MEKIDKGKDRLDDFRVKLCIEAIAGNRVRLAIKIEDTKPGDSINTLTPASAPSMQRVAASLVQRSLRRGMNAWREASMEASARRQMLHRQLASLLQLQVRRALNTWAVKIGAKAAFTISSVNTAEDVSVAKIEDTKSGKSINTLTPASAPKIGAEAASTLSSVNTAEDVSVTKKEDKSSKAKTSSAAKDSIYSKASNSKSKQRSKQKILAKRAEAKERAEQENADRERERRKQKSKQKASRANLSARSSTETKSIGKSGAIKFAQFYLASAKKTRLIAAVSVSVVALMLLRLRR